MHRFIAFLILCAVLPQQTHAQEAEALTVAKIMQDPATWIGDTPSQGFWSEDGETLYFFWNPQGQFPSDSLYKVARTGGTPAKVEPAARRAPRPAFNGWHHGEHVYDAAFQRKVYTDDGDLFIYHRADRDRARLTRTLARESNARFTPDGQGIVFERDDNLFRLSLGSGAVVQLTDLRSGSERPERKPDAQDAWLEEQQEALFQIIRERKAEREARDEARERDTNAQDAPPTYRYGDKNVQQLQIDPTERYVTFVLGDRPSNDKRTIVQNYVTASGYAEDLNARAKVGVEAAGRDLYVQDLVRDTTFRINLHQLPGAYDVVPFHLTEEGVSVDSSKTKRDLFSFGPYWNADGSHAVLEVRAYDNKDRWIARLDAATGDLTVLDRQTDEAWIAGPGISWFGGGSTMGWLPDGRRFYFQSEKSGYSHLYTVDVTSGKVTQLTDGPFEVFSPSLSKDGKTWFFTSSEGSSSQQHFYRMALDGGARTRLTTMPGRNAVALHPGEAQMAVYHSFTNRPPELFLQAPGGEPARLTHSTTEAWEAYPWRVPETIRFEASDGVQVPAHLFTPDNPNGAAVLFVHGAGYLQNVHDGWSSYFREYMFHNLLTDKGYTVMNVDYRASAGYGRDWRTAIYRYMGGRDLQDYVDASRYLGEAHGIDPEQVFIYGGSYGGFITLMALFNEAEHFGGGAALRSVTDWAHYNHTYTANILNTPVQDSLAIARSSPIYFAEGLEDPLLIAHGVIDTNVQFQDVVRLAQRLIELGKEGWEMAIYPVEGHGFTEPSSWTDEYSRILKLIEATVGPGAP